MIISAKSGSLRLESASVANGHDSNLLVWYAAQEELDQKRAVLEAQRAQDKEQTRTQREEMRKEMLGEK